MKLRYNEKLNLIRLEEETENKKNEIVTINLSCIHSIKLFNSQKMILFLGLESLSEWKFNSEEDAKKIYDEIMNL